MEKLTRLGVFGLVIALICGCTSGPRFLHPKQLWKMNRQDAWDEGTFSIPDPVDARLTQPPAIDPESAAIADATRP